MERYTKRLEDGQAVMDCANCSESWNTNPDGKCTALYCRNRLKDRLAAYEDTGLEPCDYSAMAHALKQAERAREDLTEMIRQIGATGLDRLRVLAQADRKGRCVVLPVKPGTPVWSTAFCKVDDDGTEHPTYPWPFDIGMANGWGTDWFLTQEEAEAALRREQDGNNK